MWGEDLFIETFSKLLVHEKLVVFDFVVLKVFININ